MAYNEGTLVQVLLLDYLRNELNGDESICAMDEIFGKELTIGYTHNGETRKPNCRASPEGSKRNPG